MLKKPFRRKPRLGSPFEKVDRMYKNLFTSNIPDHQKNIINKYFILNKFYDDDLFINIIIQKEQLILNKIKNRRFVNRKYTMFYPSYVPVFDKSAVLSREEYYWTYSTMKCSCVMCGKETRMFYDNFKVHNMLCGNCLNNIIENNITDEVKNPIGKDSKGIKVVQRYIKSNLEVSSDFVKKSMTIYENNKLHHKALFNKLLLRIKSEYYSNNVLDVNNIEFNKKINSIKLIFNKLV
jgi:copper chaperone CopZ